MKKDGFQKSGMNPRKLFDSYGYTARAKALRTLAKLWRKSKSKSQNEV